MSAEATGWVFRYSPMTGVAFAVHLAIADSVNDQSGYTFWMRQRNLAVKARTSRASVQRAIDLLTSHDPPLLELVRHGEGDVNLYRLAMPASIAPAWAPGQHGGVPHHEAPGASPRGRGVPHHEAGGASPRGTNNPSEPKKQPKPLPGIEPAARASGKGARGSKQADDPAHLIAAAEWERREAKPVCGFVAFRTRIGEAIAAGHSPEAVAAALPGMTVFSRNAFDFALGGSAKPGRRASRAAPVDRDRAAQAGEVTL